MEPEYKDFDPLYEDSDLIAFNQRAIIPVYGRMNDDDDDVQRDFKKPRDVRVPVAGDVVSQSSYGLSRPSTWKDIQRIMAHPTHTPQLMVLRGKPGDPQRKWSWATIREVTRKTVTVAVEIPYTKHISIRRIPTHLRTRMNSQEL